MLLTPLSEAGELASSYLASEWTVGIRKAGKEEGAGNDGHAVW